MLRITLDLVPFGREEQKKTLAIIEAGNINSHENPWKGEYSIRAWTADKYDKLEKDQLFPDVKGKLIGFDRTRGFIDCCYCVFGKIKGKLNNKRLHK
jgi:hypothetical protein